jgi:hypothetical protein
MSRFAVRSDEISTPAAREIGSIDSMRVEFSPRRFQICCSVTFSVGTSPLLGQGPLRDGLGRLPAMLRWDDDELISPRLRRFRLDRRPRRVVATVRLQILVNIVAHADLQPLR